MRATSPVQSSVSDDAKRISAPVSWEALLAQAVSEPGRISSAYRAFHGYSIGNQMLALWQCADRGIEPGPIATFKKWGELGRHVRYGEKAMVLCQPVTVKVKVADESVDPEDKIRRVFAYKRNWFVSSQTEGEPIEYPEPVGWDRERALAALDITEVPFDNLNGNIQGVAIPSERKIKINPVADHPLKTVLHEMAHCILHGGSEAIVDGANLTYSLQEVEAESVAYIVGEALGLPGADLSRGYIQHWLNGNQLLGSQIPEVNSRRIFVAAEKILRAGETPGARELATARAENNVLKRLKAAREVVS